MFCRSFTERAFLKVLSKKQLFKQVFVSDLSVFYTTINLMKSFFPEKVSKFSKTMCISTQIFKPNLFIFRWYFLELGHFSFLMDLIFQELLFKNLYIPQELFFGKYVPVVSLKAQSVFNKFLKENLAILNWYFPISNMFQFYTSLSIIL